MYERFHSKKERDDHRKDRFSLSVAFSCGSRLILKSARYKKA